VKIAFIGGQKDHPTFFTLSVYFSGCDANPKCKGCHNPELHDPNFGFEMSVDDLIQTVLSKLQYMSLPVLALVGGEPLASYNRDAVLALTKAVKERLPQTTIILFSWRTLEELVEQDLLKYVEYVDEFVLGRFEITQKTDGFPSSKNQIYISKQELQRRIGYDNRA